MAVHICIGAHHRSLICPSHLQHVESHVRLETVIGGKAELTQTVLEHLARSNAAQWGTRIPRRNRKCSDAAVAAAVRSVAAAVLALATYALFNSVGRD
jgi:hypothetical protein